MLQAIGLSKKQLIKMLCYEGLMYSVFATLVTLVLGTGLGFLSVQVVVKTILLIYGVCLIITPIIISAICLKIQCRNSLVERIKMAD